MFVNVLLQMFSATVTALLTLTAPKALGEGQQEVGMIWMVWVFLFFVFQEKHEASGDSDVL